MFRSQCSAIQFAVIGALVAPIALLPARPVQANEFETCTANLIEVGIEAEPAVAHCARALHPVLMSRCVLDVTTTTELAPEVTLASCSRDRRPDELATCVANIHNGLEVADATAVLGNCRRSPLPVRYSDCVVGTATTAALTTDESMALCIAAGYRPVDVAPTFIFSR
jgi:hypothetical protein